MLKLLYIQFLKSIYSSQEYILASWWIQELGLGEKGKGLVQNKKCKLRSIIITLRKKKESEILLACRHWKVLENLEEINWYDNPMDF